MSCYNIESPDYDTWLRELKKRYLGQRLKAAVKVNQELLRFYWSLGQDIAERQFENTYGSGFFQQLSKDLKRILPEAGGFSPNNLRYMKSFYMLYFKYMQKIPQPVGDFPTPIRSLRGGEFNTPTPNRQQSIDDLGREQLFSIPWSHHRCIIDHCHGNAERAWFYVQKTLQNGWSRSVLQNFLDTNLYDREGKAISNFSTTLPLEQSDLAQQLTKDPYCFNFMSMDEPSLSLPCQPSRKSNRN